MNWLIIISGVVASLATMGHFTMGKKSFLNPMLEASFDDVPKKVMHFCVPLCFCVSSIISCGTIINRIWV